MWIEQHVKTSDLSNILSHILRILTLFAFLLVSWSFFQQTLKEIYSPSDEFFQISFQWIPQRRLKVGWTCGLPFFSLLLFGRYSSFPCEEIIKTCGKKITKSAYFFSLLSSYVKRGKYLQIHSFHLSRATDWSRELTTQQQLSHQALSCARDQISPGNREE